MLTFISPISHNQSYNRAHAVTVVGIVVVQRTAIPSVDDTHVVSVASVGCAQPQPVYSAQACSQLTPLYINLLVFVPQK